MTASSWVPWVVFVGNCGSLLLTMRGRALGFVVLVGAQLVFAWYALGTAQYGFLAQNAFMVGVALYGVRRFRRHGVHRDPDRSPTTRPDDPT